MRGDKVSKERFVAAVKEMKGLMFRLSYGLLRNTDDAEDAVAEAILKAWQRRNQLRDVEKLGQWMVSIAVNTSKDMLSIRDRERPVANAELAAYIDEELEKQTDVWSLVSEISGTNRIAFLLYYYAGYSVKEIAEILDVPEGTVKSRLSRARAEMRNMLEESE